MRSNLCLLFRSQLFFSIVQYETDLGFRAESRSCELNLMKTPLGSLKIYTIFFFYKFGACSSNVSVCACVYGYVVVVVVVVAPDNS